MISDLYNTKKRTGMKNNWLKVISVMPGIKRNMGDIASKEDIKLSEEAKMLLDNKQ
jgi:hypothetical protein